jgi:hypothetical protein
MKPSQALLAAAEQAIPAQKATKWDALLPVVRTLLSRQFSLRAAVEWLVDQKAVSKSQQTAAYHSLRRALKHEV